MSLLACSKQSCVMLTNQLDPFRPPSNLSLYHAPFFFCLGKFRQGNRQFPIAGFLTLSTKDPGVFLLRHNLPFLLLACKMPKIVPCQWVLRKCLARIAEKNAVFRKADTFCERPLCSHHSLGLMLVFSKCSRKKELWIHSLCGYKLPSCDLDAFDM